ncbi:MAG TPA: hypothetical protein VKX17_14415 [Planctomycetota bacterium]|nr:hypothetical protein [Planctomycetota bacterium]
MDPDDRRPNRKIISAKIKARIEDDPGDWIDSEELGEDAPTAHDDEIHEPEEAAEDEEEDVRAHSASGAKRSARPSSRSESKGFFETIGEGLRSAGETATRYTKIGMARAELEKLRYDLKAAHAKLGETVMRCWADAPDLGLTSKDPAVADATQEVKNIRRKIREKEAKIAQLRKERQA